MKKVKMESVDWKQLILETWASVNQTLADKTLTEEECEQLLAAETRGKRRIAVLHRIYGKYNKLRCQRERRELLLVASKAPGMF